MVNIRAEIFDENCIHTIIQLREGKKFALWLRIKDIGEKLNIKDIFDSVNKEIKGKFETNYPTEHQIRKHNRHGSEFIEGIKFMYAHECILIFVIMHCRSPTAIECRSKVGFSEYGMTMHKEPSVLK